MAEKFKTRRRDVNFIDPKKSKSSKPNLHRNFAIRETKSPKEIEQALRKQQGKAEASIQKLAYLTDTKRKEFLTAIKKSQKTELIASIVNQASELNSQLKTKAKAAELRANIRALDIAWETKRTTLKKWSKPHHRKVKTLGEVTFAVVHLFTINLNCISTKPTINGDGRDCFIVPEELFGLPYNAFYAPDIHPSWRP